MVTQFANLLAALFLFIQVDCLRLFVFFSFVNSNMTLVNMKLLNVLFET